jgi:hypothetical protein
VFEDLEIGVLSPRGEVGDRVVLARNAERPQTGVRDRLGDELLACVVQLRVFGLSVVTGPRFVSFSR